MEKIVENYKEYKISSTENWRKRFTWMGLYGKDPKPTTSIMRFNNETKELETIDSTNDINSFWEVIERKAKIYTEWVKSKGKGYSEKEYDDMKKFFIGAIGEYFFYNLFMHVKRLICIPFDGISETYDFNYVSPTLEREKDAGVDFTAIVNDVPSVIQIKFWNPENKKNPITIDVVQKAYAEGISKDIISKDENQNVFICWLGGEDTVYRKIKETIPNYKNNVVVIGRNSLKASINGKNKLFWDKLRTNISAIK